MHAALLDMNSMLLHTTATHRSTAASPGAFTSRQLPNHHHTHHQHCSKQPVLPKGTSTQQARALQSNARHTPCSLGNTVCQQNQRKHQAPGYDLSTLLVQNTNYSLLAQTAANPSHPACSCIAGQHPEVLLLLLLLAAASFGAAAATTEGSWRHTCL